jgi:hypothetical protein
MVNNPILYAAIMTLWHIAFASFLIISSVYGIVNVLFLVISAAACLHSLDSLGAIIMISGLSGVRITKREITVSVFILEGTDTRAFGIGDYFPQLLKYQEFWSITCMLKELYCFSEAPLDVLRIEL